MPSVEVSSDADDDDADGGGGDDYTKSVARKTVENFAAVAADELNVAVKDRPQKSWRSNRKREN